jgi:hypothetical protein
LTERLHLQTRDGHLVAIVCEAFREEDGCLITLDEHGATTWRPLCQLAGWYVQLGGDE